jgi:hypothetical protein
MTELYRGILLVLTNKFNELIVSQRTHIQSFRQATLNNENYFDVGVIGFWNLMLEIVMTLFVLLCLLTGISLVASLAIVFYPCYAFLQYTSVVHKTIRHPAVEPTLKEKAQDSIDDAPVIIKKNDQEKK